MARRGTAEATAETHSERGTAQGVVPDGVARIPFAAASMAAASAYEPAIGFSQ